MPTLQNPKLLRTQAATLAPYSRRCRCRLSLLKTHVLNKERPRLSEEVTSYTDSTDDESPTSSNRAMDAARILFDDRHIAAWRPELFLYAPLGVLLATFRSAMWILGIALDQPFFRNQAVVEAYLRLLGVQVTWRNADRIPAGRHVMVSNHCSVGDLMMLFSHPSLPQRYTHLITSALPAQVTRARHLPVLMRPASPATYDELATSSDPSPVHLFPEGGMTNGRGMLRFSRGFTRILQQQQQQQQQQPSALQLQQQPHVQQQYHQDMAQQHQGRLTAPSVALMPGTGQGSRTTAEEATVGPSSPLLPAAAATGTAGAGGARAGAATILPPPASSSLSSSSAAASTTVAALPVVPVALRVRSCMSGVNTHTLNSSFLENLFWFGFSPSTTLEATVLPAMVPEPGEPRGAFVNRVQAAIAAELGVEVFEMTIQQKRQLVGRKRA